MNTLEKEFIPYEQALALKELGFDEPCFGYFNKTWSKENELLFPQYVGELENWNNTQHLCSAPTFSQAFRWFREKAFICHVTNDLSNNLQDEVYVYVMTKGYGSLIDRSEEYITYEEAELACIIRLIDIVKKQNLKE